MKARVKATGEVVVVRGIYTPTIRTFGMEEIESYDMEAVEIVTDPDYWTRLEHQYAGMAMQGLMTILPNIGGLEGRTPKDEIVDIAMETAHALVEELKGKEQEQAGSSREG